MQVNGNTPTFTQGLQGVGDVAVTSAIPIRLEIASRILANSCEITNRMSFADIAQRSLEQADALIAAHNATCAKAGGGDE